MANLGEGDAFLLNAAGSHLYFLLNDPIDGEAVMANFTTVSESIVDTPCVIHPGEHPFIKQESTISLDYCRIVDVPHLQRAELDGKVKRQKPVPKAILERVIDGLLKSEQTPRDVKEFILDNGLD